VREKELIKKCLEKDKAGQKALFDLKYRLIYKIAYRYLNDHQEAEDVVLQAFNNIFLHLEKFEPKEVGSFNNWITKITINQAYKNLRSKNLIDYVGSASDLDHVQVEDNVPFESKWTEQINEIIKSMPVGYKTIFLMNAVECYSHQTISELLGISRNTSKSQMLKARKYIHARLKVTNNG